MPLGGRRKLRGLPGLSNTPEWTAGLPFNTDAEQKTRQTSMAQRPRLFVHSQGCQVLVQTLEMSSTLPTAENLPMSRRQLQINIHRKGDSRASETSNFISEMPEFTASSCSRPRKPNNSLRRPDRRSTRDTALRLDCPKFLSVEGVSLHCCLSFPSLPHCHRALPASGEDALRWDVL